MATPMIGGSIGPRIQHPTTTEPQPSASSSAENLPDFKRENLLGAPQSYLEDPSSTDLEIFDELGDVVSTQQARENDSEEKEKLADPNLIEWDGPDDPENPMNFKLSRKWIITIATSLITFVATFASSVFSTATIATAEEFHVSTEVTTLGTSLFVAVRQSTSPAVGSGLTSTQGFATGPLVWGPASELFGRKVPMFIGITVFCIFQIPVAVAQNIQTVMICRYLGGFFGVAPLAIVGGTLADFWGPIERSVAITVFAGATFVGPVAGPVMGSFITESYLGWRWTAWITLIMGASSGLLGLIVIPETYHPRLLQLRAAKLRYETKNWAFHSRADENKKDVKTMVQTYLFRPIQMLIQEPILLLVTLYMALVWGILFLFFEAFPISFDEKRRWSPGIGSLPFLSILIGMLIGCLIVAVSSKTRLARKFEKHGHIVPEERLPPMIFGAIIFPIGLFWFAVCIPFILEKTSWVFESTCCPSSRFDCLSVYQY